MDKPTRNQIQKATQDARTLLETEFSEQLEALFDIHSDGTVAPEPGSHLDAARRIIRQKIVAAIAHEKAGGMSDRDAVAAYLREASFTCLNRFVALKMLEARDLTQQCISKGELSSGFKEFCGLAPGLAELSDRGYRLYIESLFDELSTEIRVLFDRLSPASLLWPRKTALDGLLSILNRQELEEIWGEDETIGWVYQYFNSADERKKMRDESAAPRNSHELAVRNQFFTPRYVVEFLTDNTLGRIWYEMRKGDTALKQECRYLVRRPNEVFLAMGEKAPPETEDEGDLSQEELLKKTVYIEHRSKKDPRDLRILDPACGSGHFLLYSFDLMERIYEEAWADPESPNSVVTGCTLKEDFETLDKLFLEVPKLIIEHNLHGIDIDHRAVQIAAMSLWLRAQKTWKRLGIKPAKRRTIKKSHIVTAEPMPGEEEMRREFTSSLKPRVLGQLVAEVFEKMKLAGEAGSLLKIEEEIKDAVTAAAKQWYEIPKHEQQTLFPATPRPRPKQQELRFDVKGITDERFWEQAEDRILNELKEYAKRAENGQATRRRLFAEDAVRGFAFIDLCHERYDVALMNPPFGLAPRVVFDLHKKLYSESYVELYAQMATRGLDLLNNDGCLGVISSRSFMTISRLRQYRIKTILPGIALLVDLGASVMDDAFVESSAYIISKRSSENILALDLRGVAEPQHKLFESIMAFINSHPNTNWVVKNRQLIAGLPDSKLLYALPIRVHKLLGNNNVLEPHVATVRQGMGTFSDFRFLRLRHEVSVTAIGRDGWEPLAKGGAFSFYYSDIHLLLNWQNDGAELSAVNIAHNGQDAQVRQASGYWRQSGLTYSKRSQKGFSARALPAECIIAGKGPAILSQSNVSLEYLLGWINSRFIRWIIEIQANDHEYNTGIVKKIPWVEGTSSCNELVKLTKATVRKVQSACGINDTNSCFIPIFNVDSLKESLEQWHRINEHAELTLMNVMADWDKFIDQLYGVDSSGLQLDDQDEDSASKEDDDEQEEDTLIVKSESAGGAIGIMVGFVFGRWDVRITLDSSFAPKLPDPFDPLPICPPGMLVGPDGLPAESNGIGSEEVLRSRLDANTLLPEGAAAQNLTITDAEYPLRISWNGILVDDPGFEREQLHEDDLVLRCREVFEILWKDKAHDIEQEACEILKIAQLRDYFRKSFFTDHIKRYSKSRRKAPIYWQLSTPSASYSIWLYYHRFTKDTFYRVMNEYVVPKLQFEERELNKIRQQYGINPTAGQRKELASREAFVAELSSFKEDVARIAPLWNPDLNDGVIINFAPLWRLVPQNKAWQKECMQVWDKLADGEYDWAHLAMHLWPERVVPKCAKDRSLAIAHGLDEVFWQEDEKGKAKPTPVSGETVKALVQERTSPTVKAALEDLLKAPAPATMAKKKRKKKA